MNDHWTWLTRCSLNINIYQLAAINSALLKNEYIDSVLEYQQEKMLVSLKTPPNILVLHDWEVVHEIVGDDLNNTSISWLAPLPGFDIETFPFVVCSGKKTFSLINVKEFRMETLIKVSGQAICAQDTAFFREEFDGFCMFFASHSILGENRVRNNWHVMPFRQDFIRIIS